MKLQKLTLGVVLGTWLSACGEEKKEEDKSVDTTGPCEFGSLGCGAVVASKDDKISISLEKGASGDKYVVMPFTVGNIDTVDGAGAEKVAFTVPAGKSQDATKAESIFSLQPPLESNSSRADRSKLLWARGELARTVGSHWVPRWGVSGQAGGFWDVVRDYDRVNSVLSAQDGLDLFGEVESLETRLRREADEVGSQVKKSPSQSLLAGTDCPTTDDGVVVPGGEEGTPLEVTAGTDYCIIYLDEPVVEPSKQAIAATVQALMETYKKTIYGDDFPAANGYTFKPNIVILDTSKEDYAINDAYKTFLGFFDAATTADNKVPMFYMLNDMTKISGQTNDAKAKAGFHATLAHEMQHAISFYFRVMKAATVGDQKLETVFLDEGLAHFMEDLFGYGKEEFPDFAGNYLGLVGVGLYPFFGGAKYPDSEWKGSENFNIYRGSAQTFLYYLASQKGSFDFTEGKISGGDGLKFIASLTTSGKIGAKNLKETFAHATWTWPETVGNYLSALILDNTAVPKVEAKHQVKEPFKEVTDLQGTKNKTFGMRFNNHESLKDPTADGAESPYTAFDSAELEVYHYHTRPGLVTVTDTVKSVEIGTPDDEGTAAAVVRIK